MYRINDKRASILEIQKYLSEIYEEENLYKSGVYDEQTKKLVIKFQAENSLGPSSAVNRETFEALFREYKKSKKKRELFENHQVCLVFPLKEGDAGDVFRNINRDLGNLSDKYNIHHSIRPLPYYSSQTAKAVKELRGVMTLCEGEEIDEEFYWRMYDDIKSIKNNI